MVRILGAGPAGLSAAITLAKAGQEVEVFERGKEVGHRFNYDGQGLENWSESTDILDDLKHMNIEVNFDCDPFTDLTVTNTEITKQLKFPRPLFYLIKRGPGKGTLDQGLKAQALAAGVKIHFETTLPIHEADIVATGPRMGELFAEDEGIIFKTSLPDMAIGILNDKAAMKGYSYLLVSKGYACMCTCIFDDFGNAPRYFEETKQMFSKMVALDIKDPIKVGGIGSFSSNLVFQEGNTRFVGEAAGIQDMALGFGIRNAITSGHLAAQSILGKKDYTKLAKKRLARKVKASMVNRYILEKFFRFKNYRFAITNMGDSNRSLKFASSVYNFSITQRIVYPFAKIHLRKRYPKLQF
jgi:flavin-dependent dehydrogenase